MAWPTDRGAQASNDGPPGLLAPHHGPTVASILTDCRNCSHTGIAKAQPYRLAFNTFWFRRGSATSASACHDSSPSKLITHRYWNKSQSTLLLLCPQHLITWHRMARYKSDWHPFWRAMMWYDLCGVFSIHVNRRWQGIAAASKQPICSATSS